jgi:hypothetical protein
LRRLVIIGTALAVLGATAAAYAATHFNSYTSSKLAVTKGAGSAAKPSGLAMQETLKVTTSNGERAAPLTDIKIKIFGVKLDVGKLPVCTDSMIDANPTSPLGSCSAGSRIANGTVNSLLGSTNPTQAGTPCKPHLNVFNGGPSKQVFYFYTVNSGDCGGLTTGQTAPYDGHISYAGGNAVIDVPLPPDISTAVAGHQGLYGSLILESLNFPKTDGGKQYMVGVGCKAGKRAWSIQFTAHQYDGSNDTQTVNGSSAC